MFADMPAPLTILSIGFLLGLKHATDADHVVAVTTIVARERNLKKAAMVGMSWGIGHTLMIMVVGVAIILFQLSIPPRIQNLFELSVAIALVILGILTLTGISERFHTHDFARPFVVGLIHGLAGSSAIALLILGSITDTITAILYLGIFGVGTIVGMMTVTTILGLARVNRTLTVLSGLISIAYGIYFGLPHLFQLGLIPPN